MADKEKNAGLITTDYQTSCNKELTVIAVGPGEYPGVTYGPGYYLEKSYWSGVKSVYTKDKIPHLESAIVEVESEHRKYFIRADMKGDGKGKFYLHLTGAGKWVATIDPTKDPKKGNIVRADKIWREFKKPVIIEVPTDNTDLLKGVITKVQERTIQENVPEEKRTSHTEADKYIQPYLKSARDAIVKALDAYEDIDKSNPIEMSVKTSDVSKKESASLPVTEAKQPGTGESFRPSSQFKLAPDLRNAIKKGLGKD